MDGVLRFRVTDTGIGFDDAVKARLFHRFEQADLSIRRRFGGTGLGLAICRSLLSLMGGSIDAESRPGEGATFTVLLPLEPAEAAPAVPPAAEDHDVAELPGLHVLLAEDHPTNQRVVRLILEAVGVELTVVDNGALAVEAFTRQRFDLVLMDIRLQGEMTGVQAARAIWEAQQIPIVFVTANADASTLDEVKTVPSYGFVVKPLHSASIQAVVELALDRREKELR